MFSSPRPSVGLNSVLNVKAVVAAFNQEKALLGAFSVHNVVAASFFSGTSEFDSVGTRHRIFLRNDLLQLDTFHF